MIVFQISSELNVGSVGRIAEQIGEAIIKDGGQSIIAYGRERGVSSSMAYQIGNKLDFYIHALGTRLTDRHGFFSTRATVKLIEEIKRVNPDIIHMQHLHGYYINIEILFNFLADFKKPVVWTFHDCWSFTGHCAYYDMANCSKWRSECNNCPQLSEYPKAVLKDSSKRNFSDKKRLFTSVDNLTIVPVSNWLELEVRKSFLASQQIKTIQNGIDLNKFRFTKGNVRNRFDVEDKYLILGVANPWDTRKGLKFFIEMSTILPSSYQIILIGLTEKQCNILPDNMIGLLKTDSLEQLVEFYSEADVFVNPTLEDTFPTTNLEALACGTPVVTFNSGGSSEAIDSETGVVVHKKDVSSLCNAIFEIQKKGRAFYSIKCEERARRYFDKRDRFQDYIKLYKDILERN